MRLLIEDLGGYMKEVSFWGSSDDLVEIDGDIPGCDEYNVYQKISGIMDKFRIYSSEGDLDIYAVYNGEWVFAPGLAVDEPDQEGVSIPKWAEKVYIENAPNWYSVLMILWVPDDARVELISD